MDGALLFGLGVEDSLAAVCMSFVSLLIALSISVGDFNLIFSIVFLEIMYILDVIDKTKLMYKKQVCHS